MDVILGVLMHCIVFSNSWDISGAVLVVGYQLFQITKAPLTNRMQSAALNSRNFTGGAINDASHP